MKTTIKLNDLYNTVIFCKPGDDPEKVKAFYEKKMQAGFNLREEQPSPLSRRTAEAVGVTFTNQQN